MPPSAMVISGALGADRFRNLVAQKRTGSSNRSAPSAKRSRHSAVASEDTPPKRPQMPRENASSTKDSCAVGPGLAERGRLLSRGRDAAAVATRTASAQNCVMSDLVPLEDGKGHMLGPQPASGCDGFQRAHLEKWMQRAADAVPRSRCAGGMPKAKTGGLQEAYLRAVRDHLSRCHLAAFVQDKPKVDDKGNQTTMLVTALDVCECPEGFLVQADVLQGASNIADGRLVRFIFHRRHPVFKDHAGWTPRRGCRFRIDGFVVAADCPSGSVILPQLVVPAM